MESLDRLRFRAQGLVDDLKLESNKLTFRPKIRRKLDRYCADLKFVSDAQWITTAAGIYGGAVHSQLTLARHYSRLLNFQVGQLDSLNVVKADARRAVFLNAFRNIEQLLSEFIERVGSLNGECEDELNNLRTLVAIPRPSS